MSVGAKRIVMILPVPVPPPALDFFAAQIPARLQRPEYAVEFVAPKNGARILDSFYETTLADAFVLDAGIAAAAAGAAAICVNSMSDSGVQALRSRLDIPVVGPAQATFALACLLGQKFSVITMWDRWTPLYHKAAKELGIDHRLASVRHIDVRPDAAELLAGKEDFVFPLLEAAGRAALTEDGADVLILGSTTMHQSHGYLAANLPVPVLNPGLVGLKVCEMMLDLGLLHSPKAYPKPEVLNDSVWANVPSLF